MDDMCAIHMGLSPSCRPDGRRGPIRRTIGFSSKSHSTQRSFRRVVVDLQPESIRSDGLAPQLTCNAVQLRSRGTLRHGSKVTSVTLPSRYTFPSMLRTKTRVVEDSVSGSS